MAPLPVHLIPPAISVIAEGGTAVVALYGPLQGGVIVNPQYRVDQDIPAIEELYICLTGDATLYESDTTFKLYPGQTWNIPEGTTTNVSVNAATSGHRFGAYAVQPPTPYPPTPQPGNFPPDGPTTLLETIPAYPYQQYADDENIQAFFLAFNTMVQEYVDWFNSINLPIYTSENISGLLLDWVAKGLYGMSRPGLASGQNQDIGPLNTFAYNEVGYAEYSIQGPSDVVVTTDDVFKRIITWNFYKGDGKTFDIRWLKRRVARFLLGENGTSFNIDQTYLISVTFGVGNQVNINLSGGSRTITGGALYGEFALNEDYYLQLDGSFYGSAPFLLAPILKEAIESGVLQLPFQFDYVVNY